LDIINLVLGNSKETEVFWNKIIRPQILEDYNYEMGEFPVFCSSGGLLHAICYHLRIALKFDDKSPIFKAAFPFTKEDLVQIDPHTKVY
jgi:hypothetical protein